jgi:hypothetical protein
MYSVQEAHAGRKSDLDRRIFRRACNFGNISCDFSVCVSGKETAAQGDMEQDVTNVCCAL